MPSRKVDKPWVQRRLREIHKTQAAFAAALGIYPSGMTNLLKGLRELSAEEAHDAAKFLDVSLMQVYEAFGLSARRMPYGKLIIRGYIDATSGTVTLRADVDSGPLEEIDAPFPGYLGCAVKIKGASMAPRYLDGEAIGYTPDGHDISRLIGGEVVAELEDGRRLLKILQRGTEPDHYSLISLNRDEAPIQNVRLKWAAPVDWHLPRRS